MALTPNDLTGFLPATMSLAFLMPAAPGWKLKAEAILGSDNRRQAKTKSLAVTGSPFDHLAFSRIVKVLVSP